ncbi:MAG: hypothetical protein VKQ33_06930 [Candidatus Sericytochromatia bacterium]|nr:hypothetical protein [Candidatus Sericytochromatia bacterium]
MPRATRCFETDLGELAYQIARSDAYQRLVSEFRARRVDDQELQENVLELLDGGRCKFFGDRGPEEWSWVLSEAEVGKLAATLFREAVGDA